jgi:hypothetical protein
MVALVALEAPLSVLVLGITNHYGWSRLIVFAKRYGFDPGPNKCRSREV